ncbi:MAG: glycosyltransferase family 4 protein [Armatimonadota bacterium]
MSGYTYFIGVSLGDGAIPDHFRALAHELVGRGHKVLLLPWGPRAKEQCRPGNPGVLPWPSKRPTRPADALLLYRLVKRCRPHCFIGNFGAVNTMMLVGWLTRVRVRIAWYHTLQGQIDLDWTGSKLAKSVLRRRKQLVYRLCVIGNSRAAVEEVCREYGVPPRKTLFFYNSLRDPLRSPGVLDQSSERHSGLVLCAGRFHPCKGQDVLIEASANVAHRVTTLMVRFLGDGPLLEPCRERARALGIGNVCDFAGRVLHDDVLRDMARAEVTVVPSRDEAFGLVALESMAVGTPVVASRVGGLAEIVRDGIDGFLVPPGDPEALADRLVLLLSNRGLRERMGRNARERFLEDFEQTRMVRKQADWFEQVVRDAF